MRYLNAATLLLRLGINFCLSHNPTEARLLNAVPQPFKLWLLPTLYGGSCMVLGTYYVLQWPLPGTLVSKLSLIIPVFDPHHRPNPFQFQALDTSHGTIDTTFLSELTGLYTL